MRKCKHTNIQITRYIQISHVSDLKQFKDKYDEPEIQVNWDDATEWILSEAQSITVFCKDCKKSWKNKEKFPFWLEEVLDAEESHFGER